jgi:shikimate dehydrogenase
MSEAERRRFGLLGHPVGHSVSPAMHSAAFRAHQLPHTYGAFDVPTAADLARFVGDVRGGAIAGVNVTVPHKRAVMALVDDVDESAEQVGAANVLCRTASGRVAAYNTDVPALQDELLRLLRGGASPDAPRQRAVILGAGGAALAAISACRALGFQHVHVTTRSWTRVEAALSSPAGQRARALGASTAPWPASGDEVVAPSEAEAPLGFRALAATAELVVQATSAGMLGGPPGDEVTCAVPWGALRASTCLYDVVYNPPVTPFLRLARERGLRALDGLGMLVGQAARSFTLWTGLPAPLDAMRSAAEDALRAPAGAR